MTAKQRWHPLHMVGVVLLINSVVFSALTFVFHLDGFLGVLIGCAGTGIAVTITGFVLPDRSMTPGSGIALSTNKD